MLSTYTICAWGGIGLVASGYYYLYRSKPKANKPNQQRDRERMKASQKEKENKTKKLKSGGESSGNENQKRNEVQKRNKSKRDAEDTTPSLTTIRDDTPDNNDVDDREFARQLSNVKTGTSMAAKKETGSRQKSVKLSKALASDDDDNAEARKTNGEHVSDGDDDMSSVASPELNATVPKAGDVSDMFENNKSTGPTILKLTEPTTTQPPKAKKETKPKEPELTKKQRQNQAKKEASKVRRLEEEKTRRVKEEKQRKLAREASGRSAKDGSSTLYSPPPPKTSPWTATENTSKKPHDVELLHTYEAPAAVAGSNHAGSHETVRPAGQQKGAANPAAPPASEYSHLPSEEEQMRLLSENDESGWAEVKSKKSKGKLGKTTEVLGGNTGSSDTITTNGNGTGKFAKLGEFETEA